MSHSKFINIWSSRGFIQSLSEEQQAAFINLSANHENIDAMIEQAKFENGFQPIKKTDILFAIRYAINRESVSSSDVAYYLKGYFDEFDKELKEKIIKEIESGLEKTASEVDLKIWTNTLIKLKEKNEPI